MRREVVERALPVPGGPRRAVSRPLARPRRDDARRRRLRRPAALRLRPARRRGARPRGRQCRHRRRTAASASGSGSPTGGRASPPPGRPTSAATFASRCSRGHCWPVSRGPATASERPSRASPAPTAPGPASPGCELRSFRGLLGRSETLRVERMLAESLLWRHILRHHSSRLGAPDRLARSTPSMPPIPGRATSPRRIPDPGDRAHRAAADAADVRRLRPRAGAGQPADPDDRPAASVRRLHRQVQPRPQAGRGRAPGPDRHRRPDPAAARRLAGAGRGLQRPRRAPCRRVEVAFARDGGRPARDQPRRPVRRDDLVDRLPRPRRPRADRARPLPLPDPGVRAVHVRDGLLGGARDGDLRRSRTRRCSRPSSCAPTSPPTASASSGPGAEAGRARLGLLPERDHGRDGRRPPPSSPTARAAACSSTRAPSRTPSATCSSSA